MLKQPRNTAFVLFIIAIIAGTVYYYNRPEVPEPASTEKIQQEEKEGSKEFNTEKFEGTYKSPDGAYIVTSTADDEIYVEGEALWANELTTNVGRVKGNILLTDSKGILKDGECEIQIKITERKITSTDNSKCGGFNVSFSGEYIKN